MTTIPVVNDKDVWMSNSETKIGMGPTHTGQSPVHEVKTAMAGFINDFKTFQDEIKSRIKEQEQRLTMLDRKSFAAARPAG